MLVQGDIKPYNFLIDPETQRITLIDFGCVCALPFSFVSFTLRTSRDPFITGIAEALNWQKSDNLSSMVEAAYLYMIVANNRLGRLIFYSSAGLGLDNRYRPGQAWVAGAGGEIWSTRFFESVDLHLPQRDVVSPFKSHFVYCKLRGNEEQVVNQTTVSRCQSTYAPKRSASMTNLLAGRTWNEGDGTRTNGFIRATGEQETKPGNVLTMCYAQAHRPRDAARMIE